MSFYSAKQLNEFRTRIGEHIDSLNSLQQTANDAAETVTLDQSKVGRLSRMDALQGQAMAVAAVARRKIELSQAEQAIKRIDAGEFGECTECLEQINPKRLEHNPTVALCIQCASSAEKSPYDHG